MFLREIMFQNMKDFVSKYFTQIIRRLDGAVPPLLLTCVLSNAHPEYPV
ncbi:hypothetical protein BACCAP_04372 [Pseudoflavonifractor capillosus ATCC 29799]|uniref:Uncharacterized protein n=1 Tax=Pseudoflavonifractor capillosus ATCC 29799 TaxID=411467 RepID=A6P1K5_9FIRM|nr:hypothetical protein BACCAP_04372 [Pseudoflavonifractor capillosus ATCC 29799]